MLIAASFTTGMAAADDTDHDVRSFLDRTDPNQRLTVSHVHGAGSTMTHWVPVDSPPHDFRVSHWFREAFISVVIHRSCIVRASITPWV